MPPVKFKAYAITNEIDLNKIAAHCGIPKKFTWEQPLTLKGEVLAAIIKKPVTASQAVLVFSFGSVVFIEIDQLEEIKTFLEYLRAFEPSIDVRNAGKYVDDYSLHIGESEYIVLTDETIIVPVYEQFYLELISTVLAKSVAFEKIEEELGKITDKLEILIDRLEKGKLLRIGNKELARTTAKIVRHEYNTFAYVMILDKPEITWTNSEAGECYDMLIQFFELNDRYKIMKSKTDTLYRIMEGFSSISHSIRGLFVEWIIVFLIVFEVILTLLQMAGWLP